MNKSITKIKIFYLFVHVMHKRRTLLHKVALKIFKEVIIDSTYNNIFY